MAKRAIEAKTDQRNEKELKIKIKVLKTTKK